MSSSLNSSCIAAMKYPAVKTVTARCIALKAKLLIAAWIYAMFTCGFELN